MNIKAVNGSLGAYQAQMNRPTKADAERAREAGGSKQSTNAQSTSNAQASGDRINVSFDGVLRTSAFSTAMRTPDIRQEKVDSIKQSLENGTYTIDNHKIATKLVQDERAIFGK